MEVMRNDDGFVLKNEDGLVLKGNYDFGRALSTGALVRMELPAELTRFSMVSFARNLRQQAGYYQRWMGYNNAGTQTIGLTPGSEVSSLAYSGTVRVSNKQVGMSSGYNTTDQNQTKFFYGFAFDPTVFHIFLQGGVNGVAPNAGTTFSEKLSMVHLEKASYSYMVLFDKYLAHSEAGHIYNLGMGEEPLTTQGVIGLWKFDVAEILPCYDRASASYINKVGIRDQSGNGNHMYFINLPAGTLEEQRTYSNNNLIVTW